MNAQPLEILNAALALPEVERMEIAHRLLASVAPPGSLCEDDADFLATLEQRVARYDAGETEAAPWEVVREHVLASLKERKAS